MDIIDKIYISFITASSMFLFLSISFHEFRLIADHTLRSENTAVNNLIIWSTMHPGERQFLLYAPKVKMTANLKTLYLKSRTEYDKLIDDLFTGARLK